MNVSVRTVEAHRARIHHHEPSDQALAEADDFADRLQRHHRAQHARQCAHHAGLGAGALDLAALDGVEVGVGRQHVAPIADQLPIGLSDGADLAVEIIEAERIYRRGVVSVRQLVSAMGKPNTLIDDLMERTLCHF